MLKNTQSDTLAYQQGRQEALEQARRDMLRRLHYAIIGITMERFPEIVLWVSKQVSAWEDLDFLWHLIVKVSTLRTAEEVKHLVLTLASVLNEAKE